MQLTRIQQAQIHPVRVHYLQVPRVSLRMKRMEAPSPLLIPNERKGVQLHIRGTGC